MNKKIRNMFIKFKYGQKRTLVKNKFKKIFKGRNDQRLDELESQVYSLYKLLDLSVDITKLKPIDGPLREIQKGDTLLLGIFHKICSKYQLTYWIDYGTLLGSIRHNGFIPREIGRAHV